MPHPLFDPSKAVTFDVARGRISMGDLPGRVLVPAEALLALALTAGSEAAVSFAQALGEPMGEKVAQRLGGSARGASLDAVVDQLGGELAVAGLGALSLERWGHALVLVVDDSPFEAHGDLLLATLLAAALYRATSSEVYCWPLAREASRVRIYVGAKAAVARIRTWLDEGARWGDVLAKLHASPTEARGEA